MTKDFLLFRQPEKMNELCFAKSADFEADFEQAPEIFGRDGIDAVCQKALVAGTQEYAEILLLPKPFRNGSQRVPKSLQQGASSQAGSLRYATELA